MSAAICGARSPAPYLGGTTFEFYMAESSAAPRTPRLQLQRELDQALVRDEFRLHYQPQVCLRSGDLVAFEALLRWARPDGNTSTPADFIPILEDSRLLVPVGRWVLQTACAQPAYNRSRSLVASRRGLETSSSATLSSPRPG